MPMPERYEQPAATPFPLFEMLLDGKRHWMPLGEAGRAYDSGWIPVHIGGGVLDGPGRVRAITDAERSQIAEVADEWSASK